MLVGLLALLCASGAGPDTSATDAVAVVESFHRALSAGDREAVLAALDPDVVIFEAGGVERSRDEYASHHLAGDLAFAKAVARTTGERRQGASGDTAWVLTRSETAGRFREKDVATRDTETMLLRRSGGTWRIVHVHWSSRAAKK